MPTPRDLARAQALGRIVLGGALAAAPRRTAAPWLGARAASQAPTAVVAAAMGARDLGIGLGTARAVGAGFGARPWIAAGVLADATDLIATLRARDELPAGGVAMLAALAGGSALLGVFLSRALD
ncbi:MAG TPA: hypothetical protein VF533_02140 [Solirubrobacteraceae bacterium]|jgi:ribulose kinase